MPFEIVRNDITKMNVDAIVNTANLNPVAGAGVDGAIHLAAGRELLEARKKIGMIAVGDAAITPAYRLNAKYVIHTVGPVWLDGAHKEPEYLRSCYLKSLNLAAEYRCASIAFPMISTGTFGFPKNQALEIAVSCISRFLMEHEMMVYLVVFDRKTFSLSEQLFRSVASYIDDHYVEAANREEYGNSAYREKQRRRQAARNFPGANRPAAQPHPSGIGFPAQEQSHAGSSQVFTSSRQRMAPLTSKRKSRRNLEDLLEEVDATFSEALLGWISRKGKTDPEVYKKANIDRKLFSKIRSNAQYRPSKSTALALAIALELNLDETKDLIGRAGYALTHSSKSDIIIEFCILQENYDIFEINEILFAFEQTPIGG